MTDLEVAIAAAAAGAAVVRSKYGTVGARYDKSATDFATDADLAAERAILEVIQGARPGDAILGEEYGAGGGADASRRWLVDPLCGTLNFAAGTPLFSVNVALQVNGAATAAAIVDPVSGEIFWTDGETARVRHDGSEVELVPSADSLLVDVNLDPITDGGFLGSRLLADPAFRAFGQRVLSTTLAVAWVAAGRRTAYVTDGNLRDSVHFTAGLALCRAAGCVVTDLRGGPLYDGPGVIAAADEKTHAILLELITPHL